jgi:hypothetical protein
MRRLTVRGRYKPFFGELNRLGYIEGRNLIVERYSALGQTERYGVVARAAVASHPDLIISIGTLLARLLMPLTATIPILTTSADPVASGLVNLLRRLANMADQILTVSGREVNDHFTVRDVLGGVRDHKNGFDIAPTGNVEQAVPRGYDGAGLCGREGELS